MKILCPICDADVQLASDTEVTEIIVCADCQSRLVVETLAPNPILATAPIIEEDWGE